MTVLAQSRADAGRTDNPLAVRMSRLACLAAAERQALDELPKLGRCHPAHAPISPAGQVQPPQVLLSGWACHQRTLRDGRRQIVSFLLPGDVIGSLANPSQRSVCDAQALTAVTVADAHPLLKLMADGAASGLTDAARQIDDLSNSALCDQVVRLGRQTAYERVVHLILEFSGRLAAVGQLSDDRFALPLTQEVMADALGLSVVHINRTLQQVRRDRLFDMRSGQVTLRQRELMVALADWQQGGASAG